MAEGEPQIDREHLPDDFLDDIEQGIGLAGAPSLAPASPIQAIHPASMASAVPPAPTFVATPGPSAESTAGRLDDMASQAIRDAIARHGGNISAAARELGVSRNTLYRKMPH